MMSLSLSRSSSLFIFLVLTEQVPQLIVSLWKLTYVPTGLVNASKSVCEICSNALQAGKGKMSEYVSILSQYFNLLPKIQPER